jgi:drug/metabolite transporter (DMT)-like permease
MIFAYFICIAWGIMYYLSSRLTKIGLSYSGFGIILLPITLGVLIYGYMSGDYERDLKLINRDNFILMILFMISSFFGNFLVFVSMKTVDPFTISILEFGYPVVIFLIMLLMKEVQPNWNHLIGMILTFCGIYLILKQSSH